MIIVFQNFNQPGRVSTQNTVATRHILTQSIFKIFKTLYLTFSIFLTSNVTCSSPVKECGTLEVLIKKIP
jgi:hypothetical protein